MKRPITPMPQYIAVSFTLKGQDFEKDILPQLQQLALDYQGATLVHAFLPRALVERKRLPTDVVDALDRLFPNQINFYSLEREMPMRSEMADYVVQKKGQLFVIGNVEQGVQDEATIYEAKGVKMTKIAINASMVLLALAPLVMN